jgi:hypothetical protein
MRRDAIGASGFGQLGGMDRIRVDAATGVAEGCHMIDIHAQAKIIFHL